MLMEFSLNPGLEPMLGTHSLNETLAQVAGAFPCCEANLRIEPFPQETGPKKDHKKLALNQLERIRRMVQYRILPCMA